MSMTIYSNSNQNPINDEMRNIATGFVVSKTEEEIAKDKNQIRLFILASAKRELERVVKLTDLLDEMQDKYIESVRTVMGNADMNQAAFMLPQVLDTIMKCIDRSNKAISQIAGDEKLMNLLYIDTKTIMKNEDVVERSSRGAAILDTPLARDKVRSAIEIISKLTSENNGED